MRIFKKYRVIKKNSFYIPQYRPFFFIPWSWYGIDFIGCTHLLMRDQMHSCSRTSKNEAIKALKKHEEANRAPTVEYTE